ncbi:MAG: histidine phosphatase family protein, partial [Sphingobium sp.]
NPGLEDLILDMVPEDGSAIRDAVEAKYPTAAIATLTFDADHWADIARPAVLTGFVRPRDLDAALGPEARRH